ncbi:MAG: hypothetical protein PHF51_04520 [Candidatus ainarchaeum sp.]|nr:hypothetical protein [Candidatus ainarchaeum sp.]
MEQSREAAFQAARKKLKEAYGEKDALLVHTVKAIDEIDKVANLFMERLREWYGLYFPELNVSDPEAYCKVVVMFDRQNLEKSVLADIVGSDKAEEIIESARHSVGADFAEDDLNEMRALASEIVSLYNLRNGITEYQARTVKGIAPNLCYLVEPALAAKLVAQAGGIRKMAMFPASTVQVLGAEKALFKHLRTGSLSPKYGLIFQDPLIGNAPPGHAGKLARALATKLSIASKADAFSHNFIAKGLKETLDKRAAEVAKLPAERKSAPPAARGQRQEFRPRRFSRQEGGRGGGRRESFAPRPQFGGGKPGGFPRKEGPRPEFRREEGGRRGFGGGRPREQGYREGAQRPGGFNRERSHQEGSYRPGGFSREGGQRPGSFNREAGQRPGGFSREGGGRQGGQRPGGFHRGGGQRPGGFGREGGERKSGPPQGGFHGKRDFRRQRFNRR